MTSTFAGDDFSLHCLLYASLHKIHTSSSMQHKLKLQVDVVSRYNNSIPSKWK